MVDLKEQFEELKELHSDASSRLDYIEEKIKNLESEQEALVSRQSHIAKARAVIQDIAFKTQQNLEFHVSSLVTSALKHVSMDWPDYKAEFVKRRNKTECDLLFVENEKKQHPKDAAGFGAVDVGDFAQRIGYWTLRKNRPTFPLDEPFRNVSPDLQHKVGEMLDMVCKKIKLQILLVSHAVDVNMAASKTYQVKRIEGISQVKEV